MARFASKVCCLLLALAAPSAWAEDPIWRWVGDDGEVNYTNDPATIPADKREKATQTQGAALSVVHGPVDTASQGSSSSLLEAGQPIVLELPPEAANEPAAPAPEVKKSVRQLQLFSADWCEPCKVMKKAGTLEQLVKAHPELKLVEIDADAEKDRAKKIGLVTVPTVLFVDARGKELGRVRGLRDLKGFEAALEKANRAGAK